MKHPAYLEIAFAVPLDRTFHYDLPMDESLPESWIGRRVLAPFGKTKTQVGFVVGWTDQKPSFPTKSILKALDETPFITPSLLKLARWVADTYLCSMGEALAAVAPPALAAPKRFSSVQPKPLPGEKAELFRLTSEQSRAVEPLLAAVDKGVFAPFLIRGITDSGKTEVYFRAIEHALKAGRQALYLLPEIALTPLFAERLEKRFGPERVRVWHSGITPGERWRTWTGVRDGRVHVLLGARSAVFAPFPRLGVIVVDEEHEPSFKQEDRPRYHTRDVAMERARLENIVTIFGSATPSLEIYTRAKAGEMTLLELTSRIEERELPPIELIDKRRLSNKTKSSYSLTRSLAHSHAVFSEPLHFALEQRLARREQSMLFVNRRGYTPFMRCQTCGWVARCSRCSTTMTCHIKEDFVPKMSERKEHRPVPADTTLQCHACALSEKAPICCPSCQGMRLRSYGTGTQRVEQEVQRLFPFAKTARLDRDTAGTHRAYERLYREFASGKMDVLIGTQMIAKGFDFPNVTLVGVVDADVSLHLPDFRAAERTFQLITQVAGRTGRGPAGGKVMVQTHHPDHFALLAAQKHDFETFYKVELSSRKAFHYPPFSRLVLVLVRSAKEEGARLEAEVLADVLTERLKAEGVEILGPAPAPYSRIRGQFRYQILLKTVNSDAFKDLQWLKGYRPKRAFLTVDVDPMDLL